MTIKDLDTYVRLCIVEEHAHKDFEAGYTLDVEELSQHQIRNFVDELMKHDSATKDCALHEMQQLIDKQLYAAEESDKIAARFYSVRDLDSGDIRWEQRRG